MTESNFPVAARSLSDQTPCDQPPERPVGTQPLRINGLRSASIIAIHVLALAAFVPWLFSWTGLILVLIGHHAFGMLGITLGYHRLLTHGALKCPKWFERLLATLGVCCLQDTPARWVAIHRMHHQHSDKQNDPHSPAAGFFWGHVGWLLYQNRDHLSLTNCDRYANDILRDPYYFWLERGINAVLLYVLHAIAFFVIGLGIGWTSSGGLVEGLRFGLSLVVWGVVVRTVVVWHVTWAVNSFTHVSGYQNYETREHSHNNWIVALLSHGEGWHNNHHAKPRCANNGHRWWEFDLTFQTIRLLQAVGLATQVVSLVADRTDDTGRTLFPFGGLRNRSRQSQDDRGHSSGKAA
jgi:fatty-acid desaturase